MIVLDNSVISAFSEMERFSLLRRILSATSPEVVIPSTVESEIVFDEALSSLTSEKRSPEKWIKVVDVEGYEKYMGRLHSGEAGVIALAEEKDAIAALDDLDARGVARKHGVRISGTLGIIKFGYELCPIGTREELGIIIEKLKRVHFRMNREIEREIFDTEKKAARK